MADRIGALEDNSPKRPDGIFVVGTLVGEVETIGGVLQSLSAGMISKQIAVPGLRALTEMNDHLLGELGGTAAIPPSVPSSEVARALGAWTDEAREAFQEVLGTPKTAERDLPPWIWADPRNSFLAPFWIEVLGIYPAAVVVHCPPEYVEATSFGSTRTDFDAAMQRWSRYTRSALSIATRLPSIVVDLKELNDNPVDGFQRISKFLVERNVEIDETQPVDSLPQGWVLPAGVAGGGHRELPHAAQVLHRLLGGLGRASPSTEAVQALEDGDTQVQLREFYGADYFLSSYGERPYVTGEPYWTSFFQHVAEEICRRIAPLHVLDVGCGVGFLVEALRDRGVDALGLDISAWARDQWPRSLHSVCSMGSVIDELHGEFDMISCLEVLQELPGPMAEAAIANLCRHAPAVLFSASPDDFGKGTHLTVETSSFWSKRFADQGFFRDFECDVSSIAKHAILFRRGVPEVGDLVAGYERSLTATESSRLGELATVNSERHALAESVKELSDQAEMQDVIWEQRLSELESRRLAEAVASADAQLDYEHHQLALARQLREAEDARAVAQSHIDGILQTRFYRYTTRIRKFYFLSRTAKKAPELVVSSSPPTPDEPTYAAWIATYDTPDAEARGRLRERVSQLVDPPTISILLPCYNTPEQYLAEAVESVRQQTYPYWELCIVDDCSTEPGNLAAMEAWCREEPRIKFVRRTENGHISAASNTALSLATGQWVACLDHDDTLAEDALAYFALEIAANPELGLVYSDEDKIASGVRQDPFFKPEFDPLLLLGQNYLCHLSMFRKELVDQVGGYREGYEGSQDWDLALRVSEVLRPGQIGHIPRVLYHWRIHPASTAQSLSAKSYAAGAGELAVQDHLARTSASAEVVPISFIGWNRVKWHVPDPPPLVSIIIPTRDGKILSRCLDSIRVRTSYPNYEVLVVDNGSLSREVLEYLRMQDAWVTVIRDESPFNYPAINNRAVARSGGGAVCLLNDDTEVINGDWLDEMVGQLLQPGVGAVGAKLYYGNGLVQHAGVVLGIGGVAGHVHKLADRLSFADHGRMQLPRNYSAVTAACMLVRREAWDHVGGMDDVNLPVAFNDIDFCLRLRESGWRVVWTPYAELTHYESISRGLDTEGPAAVRFAGETKYMKQRWSSILRNDPAYNPNLTLIREDATLSWPTRVPSS